MTTASLEVRDKIRRSLADEFSAMEQIYDEVEVQRKKITDKLLQSVDSIKIVDESGKIDDSVKESMLIINTALAALRDTEKAKVNVIGLKLKQQENEIASSTAARERLEAVIKASAPGYISAPIDPDLIDQKFLESDIKEIQDFELKLNPRDLTE